MPMKQGVTGWAEFSKEKPKARCRFALGRDFIGKESLGKALFVGLNPSRAGADVDDMTVVKGMGFARAWGLGGTIHANAYPYITPYPRKLKDCTEDEIALNDKWIVELAEKAKVVVLAFGSFPKFKDRFLKVAHLLSPFNPVCVGFTRDGFPHHISRISYSTPRESWKFAEWAMLGVKSEPLPTNWDDSPKGCYSPHPGSRAICQLPPDGHSLHKRKHANGQELECWREKKGA